MLAVYKTGKLKVEKNLFEEKNYIVLRQMTFSIV